LINAYETIMKRQDYTVGWICALPTEMTVAVCMLDDRHDSLPQPTHDHNVYTLGRIGAHNIVIASLPAGVIGITPAATVTAQMLSTFDSLRFGLMVGIGGGVPSKEYDIRLGDVVVSKPTGKYGGVIQYNYGKTVQGGRFERTGSLNKPPNVLLNAVASLQSKHMMEEPAMSKYLSEMMGRYPRLGAAFTYQGRHHDQLFEAEYDHPEEDPTCEHCDSRRSKDRFPRAPEDPVVHYGLIASADQVVKHGTTRDRLQRELGVLCFEMEAAGLMDNFPCLVIRGICDYADSHKNKRWQPYAAATAAAYAKELLCVIPGNQVISTRMAVEMTTGDGESAS
jgi:nucleoside phosphorylase